MTTTSRRKAIPTLEHRDKGLTCVVVVSPSQRATPLYWGQKVTVDGADRLLAMASPDTHGEPKLRLADFDALARVVFAILPADAAEGSGLLAGTPFTKAKAATDFKTVVAILPPDAAEDDEHVAVQVPVALLAGGLNAAPHGKRVDEVRPLFEDHGEAATAWYDALRAHTPEASAILLAAAGDMGNHLPPLKATQSAGDTARVSVVPPDDDELETLAPEVAKLKAALAEHAAANPTPDDTGDCNSAADAQSRGGRGVPGMINTTTPTRDARSSAGTSASATAVGGATANELCAARFSLFLAGISDGQAHAPAFTGEFEAILEGSGDRKLKQQLTGDLLDDAQEDSCATQSALRAHVDFPKLQRLALAQLLGGEWAREPVRRLANLCLAFSLLYFLPHTPTQRADEHRRRMQELMGESDRQMAELPTTMSCARRIEDLASLHTFIANVKTFVGALAVTDETELEEVGEGRSPPLLAVVCDAFFEVTTGLKFRRAWLQVKDQAPHLIYTMAHDIDSVGAMLAKGARTSRISRKVAGGDWSAADTHVAAALKFFQRRLAAWVEFTEGGDLPKSCSIYDTSDERLEADAATAAIQREQMRSVAADLARNAPRGGDRNRDRGGDRGGDRGDRGDRSGDRGDRGDRGGGGGGPAKKPRSDNGDDGDREGDLVCLLPGDEQMPLPRLANKAEWPCAPYYRQGTRCKRKVCNRAHIPIDNLSPESQKAWMDHVRANHGTIFFNHRRVKIMAEELKKTKAGATKPAPGAGAQDGAAAKAAGK